MAEYDVDQRRLFGSNADSYTVMALMNFNLRPLRKSLSLFFLIKM